MNDRMCKFIFISLDTAVANMYVQASFSRHIAIFAQFTAIYAVKLTSQMKLCYAATYTNCNIRDI